MNKEIVEIVKKEVFSIIQEQLSDEAFDENTVLMEETSCDSLDLVELVMKFEREFRIEIPDEDCKKFNGWPVKMWVEYIYKAGAQLPAYKLAEIDRHETEKPKKPVVEPTKKTTQKPIAASVQTPVQPKSKEKPIELVQKDDKTIEFRQNGKIVSLNHPQVSPLIKEMSERLKGVTR